MLNAATPAQGSYRMLAFKFEGCYLSDSCSDSLKASSSVQVKAAATVIVSTNDEDGVAEAIERFVL